MDEKMVTIETNKLAPFIPKCKNCLHFVMWANQERGDCTFKFPPYLYNNVLRPVSPNDSCSLFILSHTLR